MFFYFLHDVIGGQAYPGYQWTRQAVSDLTASDAPSFVVATGFVSVYKIFSCLVCALASGMVVSHPNKSLRWGIHLFTSMTFISAIGYSLFPLSSSGYDGSWQSAIHVYVISIAVVVLSIISLALISKAGMGKKSNYSLLGKFALICLSLMFIGALGSGLVPSDFFGIFERLSTYSAVVFTGVLGVWGYLGSN